MKYILLMNTMRPGSEGFDDEWDDGDLKNHIAFMMGVNEDLRAAGQLVSAEGLTFPDQAKLVRAGQNGSPVIDTAFNASKEFLAGFWIVDVDTPGRAYEIAGRISAAPGPGGAPLNMAIEVRPVMSGLPADLL